MRSSFIASINHNVLNSIFIYSSITTLLGSQPRSGFGVCITENDDSKKLKMKNKSKKPGNGDLSFLSEYELVYLP